MLTSLLSCSRVPLPGLVTALPRAPVTSATWAEPVCVRNPRAALAPSEMTAEALQADCWEGVPSLSLGFNFFYFKYFLSGFRTDISWAWYWGGRGFSLTPPVSPRVLPSDCVTPPRPLTVAVAAPISPSAQSLQGVQPHLSC